MLVDGGGGSDAVSRPKPPPPPPPKPPKPKATAGVKPAATPPLKRDSLAAPGSSRATGADSSSNAIATLLLGPIKGDSIGGSKPADPLTSFFEKLISEPQTPQLPSTGGTPPRGGFGLPPRGTAGVLAPSKTPEMTAAPAGVLYAKDTDPTGAAAFKTAEKFRGDAGTTDFINGRIANDPRLSSQQQDYVKSLSVEQRTQIAMEQLGPAGTTKYLATLNVLAANPRRLNVAAEPSDPAGALSTFQSGFNGLVKDGKVTTDDIKALAAAPGEIIKSGDYGDGLSPADFNSNSKLFANLDGSNPNEQAAMNYFAGSSFDTADVLRAEGGANADKAADYLYAQGSNVLGATSPDNQQYVVSQTGSDRLDEILKNSLNGETLADKTQASDIPGYATKPAPLTGSSQLLNAIADNGYDDSGRLALGSPEQQKVLNAYNLVMGFADGSDKSGPTAQDLIKNDQNGSGLRLALANVFSSGMPSIVNDSYTRGGSEQLATSLENFSQLELTGQGKSIDEKQQIERDLGASLGEFAGDAQSVRLGQAPASSLDSKYGSIFSDSAAVPGGSSSDEQVQNAYRLFGNMVGGVNQGLLAVQASDNKKPDGNSDSDLLTGAILGAAGAAILTVAPEATPLVLSAANGLIAGGGALSTKGVLEGEANPSSSDSSGLSTPYLTGVAQNVGGSVPFLQQLQDTIINSGLLKQIDRDAFTSGYSNP